MKVKEDEDICTHGLILQYSNEKLKETIRICDDVVSADFMVVNKMFGGSIQHVLGGRESISTILDEKMNTIFSSMEINDASNDVEEAAAGADADEGILFTIFAKHPEFCQDSRHIEWIISHFLSEGTQCLLQGDTQAARGYAYFASCFEQIKDLLTEGKMMNTPKLMKLYSADEHTLCSFFRNRIPCSCLHQIYKEVKSVAKTDMCWNIECRKPDRFHIDIKSMMCCSRCRQACYCCSECQEIDWSRHKNQCGWAKDLSSVFGKQTIDELENNKVWNRTFLPHFLEDIELLKQTGKNANPFMFKKVDGDG